MTTTYELRRALATAAGRYQSADPSSVTAWTAARSAYQSALTADTPVWTNSTAPLLLTPARLEVRYLAAAATGEPPELAIRVIPDDIAHYTFEPDLTADEQAAGRAFWDQVGAGTDVTAAWATINAQFGNARAAWLVETTPRDPATPPGSPRTTIHPATSLLLPDKFTFRGWRDDELIFDVDGAPIPTNLPLGPDFSSTDAPPPWTDQSAWVVDLAEAVKVGMAARIPLTGTDLAFDKIIVTGVLGSDAADGADRWGRTLQGHLYTRGLTYPPVGSPTNNTDTERSDWSTAPQMRSPGEVDAAVAKAVPGSGQPGVVLADAFGLPTTVAPATPGRRDLLTAPGSTERDDHTLRDLCYETMASYYRSLIGPQLGFIADWAAGTVTPQGTGNPTGWLTSDARQAHFARYVRSDCPLPPLRVGRQPYGVLPVTSLVSWGLAADPGGHDELIQQIVARQQATQLGDSIRLGEFSDQDQDPVLLGLLQRLPTALAVRSPTERFDVLTPVASGAPAPFPLAALVGQQDSVRKSLFSLNAADVVTQTQALVQNAARTGAGTTAGLFWALQAYAAEYWQSVWATFSPVSVTQQQWTAMNATLAAQLTPLRLLEGAATGDAATIDRLLAGALEALTCRVDAWATSLAAARLQATRQSTPAGLHIGMYGWLTDVKPEAPEQRTTDDGWVLSPSPQHAISAAVLLAGAQAHSQTAFDMDLRSDRVRRALVVLSGLRAGSTLEELLGYQLERAMHDHQLDRYIPALRTAYPLPLADIGDPADQSAARAAHGARLIVDGDAVRQADADNVAAAAGLGAATPDVQADKIQLKLLIADLEVVVDAVADLLLAESVHHLVGGSPLRSALAVDTIGKAGPVPDRFDVITTPTSAVAVEHTVGFALTVSAPTSWPASPRATLDPVAEAIAQWALGDPTDWQLSLTTDAATHVVALSDLGVSAIDVAVEVTAPLDNSALAARVQAHTGASGTIVVLRSDGQGGPDALVTLAAAVRAALGRCRLLDNPMQSAGVDVATPVSADADGLARRAADWWQQVRGASAAFAPGSSADPQAAIAQLAALGVADIRFDTAVSAGGAIYGRVLAVETALQTQFTSVTDLAGPAPASGKVSDRGVWQDKLLRQLRALAGPWVTGSALFPAADTSWNMIGGHAPGAPDHDDDAVADWLRDHWQVQPGVAALTDFLLAAGALGPGHPPDWLVLQQRADGPPGPTDPWVARAHPGARSAAALAAVQIGTPAAGNDPTHPCRALLAVDRWVETVPTAPVPDPFVADPTQSPLMAVQQSALTLRFDSPDSRAPQALLLAAAPDPQRDWRPDDIHATVEETLWWVKARPIDSDDVPEQEEALY